MSDERSLDPDDWDEARRIFHAAVDCCIDRLRDIRLDPVWTATPAEVKALLATPAPPKPEPLDQLFETFRRDLLPYGTGNVHPRFFGWVHGAGTVAGALGEMLAGFMNCNVAGRDHVAVYVERQVVQWCKELFGFPESASGLLTTGTSMATIIALAVARDAKSGADLRRAGVASAPRRIVGYASREAHGAIAKAFALLGLGEDALRLVPTDPSFRMSLDELGAMIDADRAAGLAPALVVASAGTVNTGAIDDLAAIAALARAEGLWLHVDAAFGGLAILAPEFRAALLPIRHADSIAFDFHKWPQVPYDAGCVLVKDEAAHRAAFSARRDYLAPDGSALAGGDPWFCEYGPEMSRGFRALKVWFTIKAYGTERLGEIVARNCRQARALGQAVAASPALELLAPVSLNIVCFRHVAPGLSEAALDRLNADIVAALQESGIAAPSTTRIGGRLAIRVCLTNHRTVTADLALLVREAERLGQAMLEDLRGRPAA
ncbi:MAG TPA: pyridoxal-dependent decarboxylase [Stellaceae bacterium]|nr:pyridoxal-dependent decarboxylase [Stellaceae bacterium]